MINGTSVTQEYTWVENEFRITYKKMIIYAFMPIFCGITSYSVWYCIMIRGNYVGKETQFREDTYTRFLSTLVILLYLSHPTIT